MTKPPVYPGDMLQCRDAVFTDIQLSICPDVPEKGDFNVVRSVFMVGHVTLVLLEEHHNPLHHLPTASHGLIPLEPGFNIDRFDLIQSYGEGIEVFKSLIV